MSNGDFDTMWLDRMMADGYAPPRRTDVALLAAAIEAQDAHVARQRARLFASAERGRPEVGHETWHQVDVRVGGEAYRLRVAQSRGGRYHVELDGKAVDVEAERTGRFERKLIIGDTTFSVLSAPQGSDYLVEVDGTVHRISGGEAGMVRAPAPAMVVAIPVSPGDEVAAGDVVAVVESMKLETALRAPVTGRVQEILVAPNTQVEGGTKLVRLEPDGDDDTAIGTERASLAGLATPPVAGSDPTAVAADALTSLRYLVLGYDIDEADARPLLAALNAARQDLLPDDPTVLEGELAAFQIFADLSSLSRNRRGPEDESEQVDPAGEEARNPQEYLYAYLRSRDADAEGLPESFRTKLRRALAHYGVPDLEQSDQLSSALYRMFLAHRRASAHVPVILDLLGWRLRHPDSLPAEVREGYQRVLDHLVNATQLRYPVVGGLARRVRYTCFDAPVIAAERSRGQQAVRDTLDQLSTDPAERAAQIDRIVAAAEPILGVFGRDHHAVMLEVMTRRYYRVRELTDVRVEDRGGRPLLTASYAHHGQPRVVFATTVHTEPDASPGTDPISVQGDLRRLIGQLPPGATALLDLYVIAGEAPDADPERSAEKIRALLGRIPETLERVAVAVRRPAGDERSNWFTFRPDPADRRPVEDRTLRGLHPMVAERLGLWRLENFDLTRLAAPVDVHLFRAVGKNVPDDKRLIVLTDVRDLSILRDETGHIRALPQLEHVLDACMDALRTTRAADRGDARTDWNRVFLYLWPVVHVGLDELGEVVRILAPRAEALGLEQVLVQFRHAATPEEEPNEYVLRMSRPPGAGLTVRITDPPTGPMRELDSYTQKVIRARRRGAVYPFELVPMLSRNPDAGGAEGTFTEYDLDENGDAVPVDRAPGQNTASIVLGTVTTPTERYPEGMTRVVLLGDPTRALGALAEPECARVCAAIALARRLEAPVEWFAVSAGAKIAMDSGTENMDWISRVLRAIIEFTQDDGEINVIVTGINVGAQPYWNAEATMLMHTKGILVMTPDSAMVLTGKQSLDYSGGVSAEDNFGIGGYDRIMGPNGQAQYWAPDVSAAVDILLAHYAHTYRAPGERFPRPAPSDDPIDRDISDSPHAGPGTDFATVGQVFTDNPGRKKPFDIRSIMRAVADADHATLERWVDMVDAEGVVVLDAHLGGQPVLMLGIESRPLSRRGRVPVDGPTTFTAGTLFPRSSKKAARAINTASGNRPLVVLANLSGFDGSPESLRQLQLEYGAEIGRAVVNFRGPIVFCVVSRYHGGAFVVFSKTLNEGMEVAAVEGSYASVLGGAPGRGRRLRGRGEQAHRGRPADLRAGVAHQRRTGGGPGGRGGAAHHGAGGTATRGALGEAGAGGRRVRHRAQHPARAAGRVGGRDRRPDAAAALHHRRGAAGHGALARCERKRVPEHSFPLTTVASGRGGGGRGSSRAGGARPGRPARRGHGGAAAGRRRPLRPAPRRDVLRPRRRRARLRLRRPTPAHPAARARPRRADGRLARRASGPVGADGRARRRAHRAPRGRVRRWSARAGDRGGIGGGVVVPPGHRAPAVHDDDRRLRLGPPVVAGRAGAARRRPDVDGRGRRSGDRAGEQAAARVPVGRAAGRGARRGTAGGAGDAVAVAGRGGRARAVGTQPGVAGRARVPDGRDRRVDRGGRIGEQPAVVPVPAVPARAGEPAAGAGVGVGLVAAPARSGPRDVARVRARVGATGVGVHADRRQAVLRRGPLPGAARGGRCARRGVDAPVDDAGAAARRGAGRLAGDERGDRAARAAGDGRRRQQRAQPGPRRDRRLAPVRRHRGPGARGSARRRGSRC